MIRLMGTSEECVGLWTRGGGDGEGGGCPRRGENATVDDRLLRLFHVLSGEEEVAVAAARVRAAEVLSAMNEVDASRDEPSSEADALAASFRERRRALLRGVV